MSITTENFSEPAKAELLVRVGSGEPRPATDEDLAKFGYVKIADAFNKDRNTAEEKAQKSAADGEARQPSTGAENIIGFFGSLFSMLPDFPTTFVDPKADYDNDYEKPKPNQSRSQNPFGGMSVDLGNLPPGALDPLLDFLNRGGNSNDPGDNDNDKDKGTGFRF